MSASQIAKQLGVSPKTVRRMLVILVDELPELTVESRLAGSLNSKYGVGNHYFLSRKAYMGIGNDTTNDAFVSVSKIGYEWVVELNEWSARRDEYQVVKAERYPRYSDAYTVARKLAETKGLEIR
jgi:hypothetical protein